MPSGGRSRRCYGRAEPGGYWASPTNYKHIAMEERRKLTIHWGKDEVGDFSRLDEAAQARGQATGEFAKDILRGNIAPHQPLP